MTRFPEALCRDGGRKLISNTLPISQYFTALSFSSLNALKSLDHI